MKLLIHDKDILRHFCLAVRASKFKVQSYHYKKTKKRIKNIQLDSNIFTSPKAGPDNCLLVVQSSAPSTFSASSDNK